ncbi:hypothetical protein Tco_0736800 [Tanacetum coccineum]
MLAPGAATRNRGKAIVNSPPPTYDQEPEMVVEDDALSKEKEIDKLMALISLSFKKIYKPTNNKLRTLSNTSRAHQDNTPRINRGIGYDNQRVVNVAGARENRDDIDDELEDQELEARYLYMAQIQEVTPDAADNSGPIFDTELLQKVQNDDDNYNVFANDKEHPVQPESVNDTYLEEQGDTNITIDSLDMSTNGETVDQDENDLARERDLLASLIEKLKCKINNSKNRNKFLESSNKALVDKLKGEIKDFKTRNKSLESSNNHFKEANNKLSKTNQLMFKDLKKFQAELDRYHDVNYASKVETDCAKAKEEMVADLRYFSSLEHEVDSLKSQLETQKTQFLNEIDLLSREYYYADHMNAILGMYTTFEEFTDLQCDYVDQVVKCERLEKELSKRNTTLKSFEALQQHAIDLELALQQCQEQIKNDKSFKENQSKIFLKERE